MLDITQQKGLLTELRCIEDITTLGYQCLRPLNDSSKYDVVVDINGKFIRIQCKTAKWSTDTIEEHTAFEIATYAMTTNTQRNTRHKYSADEIDYFYTWFNGQGYLVSIQEATGSTFRWRYEYPKSNQKQGIHIADNYKIEDVLKSLAV
jgi:hypothetical protein